MRLLSDNEVRALQLAILDDVHEFCIKNNIQYSLAYGSLLGAIRHKGFIPWDDDIDIMMPRPDYERFLKEYKGKQPYYEIDSYKNDPYYVSTFAKVIDNRTYAVGPNIIDDRYVFIDIFPIDGMPNKENLTPFIESIQKVTGCLRRNGKYYVFEPSIPRKVLFFLKYIIKRMFLPSKDKCYKKLEEIIGLYDFGTTPYAGVAVSQYAYKEWMNLSVFENYQKCEFEGKEYMIIKAYDTCLRNLYGNYMQLPPESERVPVHFSKTYIKQHINGK